MSKASEYTKSIKQSLTFESDSISAYVDSDGDLNVSCSWGTATDALALAAWIIDNFGETK